MKYLDHVGAQRPPARPEDGIALGALVAIVLTIGLLLAALLWHYGSVAVSADTAGYLRTGAADLWWLLHHPRAFARPALPWLLLPPWQYAVITGVSASAGIVTGIAVGRTPAGVRYVRGRRITENAKFFAGSLAAREKADGLFLHPRVRLSREQERRHLLLIGGTGSGKTQVLAPLAARAINRGDQTLIYDYKGDITESLYSDNSLLIAPWDKRGAIWDIARDVSDIFAARALAAALIPLPQGAGDDQWARGGRQIFTGLIVAQQCAGGNWTVADLALAASSGIEEMAAVMRRHWPEALPLLTGSPRTAASYVSTMTAGLAGLHDLSRAWRENTGPRFSIRDWLAGKSASNLIIQHNEAQGDLARLLLRMCLRLALQEISQPKFECAELPVWLFLDEFLQAGQIEMLLSIAETARSKNVRLVLTAQDINRIRDVYGHEQAAALAGLVGTLILGRSRGVNARWASEIAGQTVVERYSRSVSTQTGREGGSVQSQWREQVEPVFRAENFDAQLGAYPRKWWQVWRPRLVNRLLVLAGGDTIGQLAWPLTVLPKIAPAHVPVETVEDAPAIEPTPDVESPPVGDSATAQPVQRESEYKQGTGQSPSRPDPSKQGETVREQLRRRSASTLDNIPDNDF